MQIFLVTGFSHLSSANLAGSLDSGAGEEENSAPPPHPGDFQENAGMGAMDADSGPPQRGRGSWNRPAPEGVGRKRGDGGLLGLSFLLISSHPCWRRLSGTGFPT